MTRGTDNGTVMLEQGQVVFSKCGRDKGQAFVVISALDNGYVSLVDGYARPLDKPKKKKAMHVQHTRTVFDLKAVAGLRGLQDADIRKLLSAFINQKEV